MARLRIWLRRHVRGLRRTSKSKTQHQNQRKNNTVVALKSLKISTPILISNDGVNFEPPPSPPLKLSMSVPRITERTPEAVRHSSTHLIIPQSKVSLMSDTHLSAPSTLVEEMEAAPSLCEDSDEDDAISEHLWPATPTSPTRSGRRMSFLRVLNATPDQHNHPYGSITSRPQSFDFSDNNSSRRPSDALHNHSRTSHYSVLSQGGNKRASVLSQGNKRVSMVSQSSSKRERPSFNNRRRASVMSVSAANNRLSGIEWDESRVSQRFSRRMSWGFETFSTHTSAYVPVRI